MLEPEIVREQEALGIVGLNLIYGAFYLSGSPVNLIGSLIDGLSNSRIEVDMISLSGPCFAGVDNRLMALQLVEQRLTEVTMFTAEGESVIPSEILYKKPVLIERGSFRPLTNPMLEMLESSYELFVKEPALEGETPITVLEMTIRQLQVGDYIDHVDFLDRVDSLRALKPPGADFKLPALSPARPICRKTYKQNDRSTARSRAAPNILDERYYTDLDGGLMESLGQLFRNGVKLYVYPWRNHETGEVFTLKNLEVPQTSGISSRISSKTDSSKRSKTSLPII